METSHAGEHSRERRHGGRRKPTETKNDAKLIQRRKLNGATTG